MHLLQIANDPQQHHSQMTSSTNSYQLVIIALSRKYGMEPPPPPILTYWPLWDATVIWKISFSNSAYRLLSWAFPGKILSETIDDKSTLVQVIAWCLKAPSHHLSQSWPRSMSTYGITRPQWVKQSPWQPGVNIALDGQVWNKRVQRLKYPAGNNW